MIDNIKSIVRWVFRLKSEEEIRRETLQEIANELKFLYSYNGFEWHDDLQTKRNMLETVEKHVRWKIDHD